MALHCAGETHAERDRRELQRTPEGRVPQRAPGRQPAPRPPPDPGLAQRLQSSPPPTRASTGSPRGSITTGQDRAKPCTGRTHKRGLSGEHVIASRDIAAQGYGGQRNAGIRPSRTGSCLRHPTCPERSNRRSTVSSTTTTTATITRTSAICPLPMSTSTGPSPACDDVRRSKPGPSRSAAGWFARQRQRLKPKRARPSVQDQSRKSKIVGRRTLAIVMRGLQNALPHCFFYGRASRHRPALPWYRKPARCLQCHADLLPSLSCDCALRRSSEIVRRPNGSKPPISPSLRNGRQ